MGKKGDSKAPQISEQQKRDYLAANPDVAADPYYSKHPGEHWEKLGQYENRRTAPAPQVHAPATFDFSDYTAQLEERNRQIQQRNEEYERQIQARNDEYKRQQEEAERRRREEIRGQARTIIDSQLNLNRSAALTRGLKYTDPTEAQRQELVTKEFEKLLQMDSGATVIDSAQAALNQRKYQGYKRGRGMTVSERLGGTSLLGE